MDRDRKHNKSSIRSFSRSHAEVLNSRVADVSRLLSQHNRGPDAVIIPDLLAYVRAVFLEIVRVKYWQHIEGGKLPRLSYSAQFLLYSVDFGMDEVRNPVGSQDWYVYNVLYRQDIIFV